MALRPSWREANRNPCPREASIFNRFGCRRYDSTARVDRTPVAVTVEKTLGALLDGVLESRPRAEGAGQPLAQLRAVQREDVLGSSVVPDRLRKFLRDDFQVRERLVREGEMDVRVAQLVERVDDGSIGEGA